MDEAVEDLAVIVGGRLNGAGGDVDPRALSGGQSYEVCHGTRGLFVIETCPKGSKGGGGWWNPSGNREVSVDLGPERSREQEKGSKDREEGFHGGGQQRGERARMQPGNARKEPEKGP